MYYLNARYYNPEWGRFISPDPVLDTSSAVGCNMFAYCGNDPVNKIDPTGELALFGGIAAAALVKGMIALAGLYVTTILATEIVKNPPAIPTFSWSWPKSKTKSNAKEVAITADRNNKTKQVYYHSTTLSAAQTIKRTGFMHGNKWEAGQVFAWKLPPSDYAVKNSGAHFGVIISFETDATFIEGTGIEDPLVKMFGPVKTLTSLPIRVRNVQIVGWSEK